MQMRELEYKGYLIWCSKLMGMWYVSVRAKEDVMMILWSGDAVSRQLSGITLAKAAIDNLESKGDDGST